MLGPSQKTLRPSWCPKLATGLFASTCLLGRMQAIFGNYQFISRFCYSQGTSQIDLTFQFVLRFFFSALFCLWRL